MPSLTLATPLPDARPCQDFIREVLPKVGLRWSGYRIKCVQTGMRQRVDRRISELGLEASVCQS